MTTEIAAHIAEVRAEWPLEGHPRGMMMKDFAKTLDLLEAEHRRAERLEAAIWSHKAAYTGQHTNGPEDMRQKREATRALYAALEAQEEHRE